jgi:two-component system LytT family response regulator
MITCYIIDDEIFAINVLRKYIEQTDGLTLVGTQYNAILALDEVNKLKPDLIFLDIEMPTLSGIQLAELLPINCAVIFTTGHAKYAWNAFQVNAVDFLLKPFPLSTFLKSYAKVKNRLQGLGDKNDTKSIFINPGEKGKVVQILINDILFLEACEHYVTVHLTTEQYTTHISISKMHEKLPKKQFLRIHRAFVVNLALVHEVDGSKVILKNGKRLPCGGAYKNLFLERIKVNTIRND